MTSSQSNDASAMTSEPERISYCGVLFPYKGDAFYCNLPRGHDGPCERWNGDSRSPRRMEQQRAQEFFDSLREQRDRTTESMHRLEGLVRDEAVRRVDARHGYTCEFAPDPDAHRGEYDVEEATIRQELDR